MPGPCPAAIPPSPGPPTLTSQGSGQQPQGSSHPASFMGEAWLEGTPRQALPSGTHQRDEVGEGEGQVDVHDLVGGDNGAHLLVVALLFEEVVDEPLLLVHTEPAWGCGVRQTGVGLGGYWAQFHPAEILGEGRVV